MHSPINSSFGGRWKNKIKLPFVGTCERSVHSYEIVVYRLYDFTVGVYIILYS